MSDNHAGWQQSIPLPVGYLDEQTGTLHRQATLRKMTGKEEALLTEPRLRGNGGKLITELLASCLTALDGLEKVTPEVVRRLTSADRNYLLLELRRLTFGDELEAHYRCPRCQGVTQTVEHVSSLEIRSSEDGAAQEIRVTLQDGYRDPDGRWQREFAFRLPTGEDEEAAASRRDGNPARQRDVLLARCLKQVGDLEFRRIQAAGSRILAELSMADRRLIQMALDAAAPGPNLTRSIGCDACGEQYRTTLDMSHFFPLA